MIKTVLKINMALIKSDWIFWRSYEKTNYAKIYKINSALNFLVLFLI